jgi:hypothetical protein
MGVCGEKSGDISTWFGVQIPATPPLQIKRKLVTFYILSTVTTVLRNRYG